MIENNSQITYIPDLLRNQEDYPDVYFNLITEPILQGLNVAVRHICRPTPFTNPSNTFDLKKFHTLSGVSEKKRDHHKYIWKKTFFELPSEAKNYIIQCISNNSIVISYEMPPWLKIICEEQNIKFVDIRPSPLHFCKDITLAIRTSTKEIFEKIKKHAISDQQIYLEAAILSADLRHHKSKLTTQGRYTFENLENSIIIVGQTPFDSSLLKENGSFLRFNNFSKRLKEICRDKNKIIYKPHPRAPSHAPGFIEKEKLLLEKILGREVFHTTQNAYQIISSDGNLDLVGISSGLLQEAKYFRKKSHILDKPLVPLCNDEDNDIHNYQQIFFSQLISPHFWRSILTEPQESKDSIENHGYVPHNYGRSILDSWWDYSKVITWERTIPREIFLRNGGANLQRRIEILEEKLNSLLNERKD